MMSPFFYICGATMGCALVVIGWGGEGVFSHTCLIMGGLYFGHLLTEATKERTT